MIIDKPKLNRNTPEENMALVDRWISDTADKLNILLREVERIKDGTGQTEDNRD